MQKTGRIIAGLFALVLALASAHAIAAPAEAGRGFNHAATGFPLTGGHAAAACETCHVGGLFKGTPRNCDGCHAIGKRVIATPKPNSHIVTDAPCESCHFYSHSWLGARFNHGSAVPGQCRNCHFGRLAEGKPASHATGNKSTQSCDNCHRTFAWLPASWNHNGVSAVCSSCHGFPGDAQVTTPNRKPASHVAPQIKGTVECDSCHNYVAWFPNRFKHNTGGLCSSCHLNGALAQGQPSGHSGFNGWPMECDECHTTTTAWLPALGALPSNHIPFNAGTKCSSCHVGGTVRTGATLHGFVSPVCTTCHLKGASNFLGNIEQKSIGHEGLKSGDDCSQSGCHRPAGNRGSSFINWD